MTSRAWTLIAVVLLSVVGAGWYVWRAGTRTPPASSEAPAPPPMKPLAGTPPAAGSLVAFTRQSGSPDGKDSSFGVAPLSDLADARYDENLRCLRVHMSGDRGVCLEQQGMFPVKYVAVVFDAEYRRLSEVDLAGVPSRTQVSPSGRYAGVTVFVAGHSYLDIGFSTRTSILDTQEGRWLVEDLEAFSVRRNGQAFRAVDFNFWGVTFAADNRTFYATLGTGGKTFLVRGTIEAKVLEVIYDDVECPSQSPDNTRVAYKHRVEQGIGPAVWQLQVLDLASGQRTTLAETRTVDDQVQWLDDRNVMYSIPGEQPAVMNTWVVPADGTGAARVFLPMSYSAAVVRRAS